MLWLTVNGWEELLFPLYTRRFTWFLWETVVYLSLTNTHFFIESKQQDSRRIHFEANWKTERWKNEKYKNYMNQIPEYMNKTFEFNLNFSIIGTFRWNIILHSIGFQLGLSLIGSHTLPLIHFPLSCHSFLIPFLSFRFLVNSVVFFAFATTITQAGNQNYGDDTSTDSDDDGCSWCAHPTHIVLDVLDVTVWVVPVEWHAFLSLSSTPEAVLKLF